MNGGTATIAVFDGDTLFSVDLGTPFREVVRMCKEKLGDPKLEENNFGALDYFFFRLGSSLVDDRGFFMEPFTLEKMGIKDGQRLELCYVPS